MNTGNGRNAVARTAVMAMVVVLAVGVSALGRIPVSPKAAPGSVVFVNETGHAVEGIQIVFATAPASGAESIASMGQAMRELFVCGDCLWAAGTISQGDALQLTLSETEALVEAYWYADARGFLNALWKSGRCSVQ